MRKRDYKAEYQRRQARAKAKGFKSYAHQRKVRKQSKVWIDKVVERMDQTGLLDSGFFDQHTDFDDPDALDTGMFWELFRNYYGMQISA